MEAREYVLTPMQARWLALCWVVQPWRRAEHLASFFPG